MVIDRRGGGAAGGGAASRMMVDRGSFSNRMEYGCSYAYVGIGDWSAAAGVRYRSGHFF